MGSRSSRQDITVPNLDFKKLLTLQSWYCSANFEALSEDTDDCSDLWCLVPSKGLDTLESSSSHGKPLLLEEENHDEPVGHHIQNNLDASAVVSQLVEEGTMTYICIIYLFILLRFCD